MACAGATDVQTMAALARNVRNIKVGPIGLAEQFIVTAVGLSKKSKE
jgi:hypothetical protein